MSIDNLDRKLIRCLQDHPRAAYATIARETGVSETTVKRRVESLINAGTITPAMIPDIYRLGYRTSAFVGLTVDLVELDAIAEQLTAFPEIVLVAPTMGRFDLMIFIAESSLDDLTRLISRQVAAIPGVRSTETLVTPRIFKAIYNWRLPEDA